MSVYNFFAIVILAVVSSTACFAESTIRITNGEWQPYLSNYSYEYGLASHIVTEAFKQEGISIQWGFFPWSRSYELAKQGKEWDASAVWWPTNETKNDFLVSDPVVSTSFQFFHLKTKAFQWETIQDLKDYEIGFTEGYDYGSAFMTALKDGIISVQMVSSDELNFKKLLAGRIDIFPNDPLVGYAQINSLFPPEKAKSFTHHPKIFEPSTLHLIISKKSDNADFFLKVFNLGLRKLKESGKIAEMYKHLNSGKYDKQENIWVKTEQ